MKTAIFIDHESTHCRVCDALHGEGACQKRRGQHDVLVNLPGVVKFIGKRYGPVALAKAYSDWSFFKNYVPNLNRSLIELVHVPYVSGTKNAADMRLLLDAYAETANTTDISTVVIVSCDRDFSNLAVRLRRLGKTVIGVGVEGVRISQEWIQACDKFHYYPIPKPSGGEPMLVLGPIPDPAPRAANASSEIALSSKMLAITPEEDLEDDDDECDDDEDDSDEIETTGPSPVGPRPANRPPLPVVRVQPKPPSLNGTPTNGSRPPMPRPKMPPYPSRPNGPNPRNGPPPRPSR